MNGKLMFNITCYAYPEQYDVYLNDNIVGYVRLRGGSLICEYPNVNGELIYEHTFDDSFKGKFDNDDERNHYLKICEDAIIQRLNDEHTI